MTRSRNAAPWIALSMAIGPACAEDTLGRLFFTPTQRIELDRERVAAASNSSRPVTVQTQPKAPPPKMVTLNGIVRRSDGETTIWVNNKPLHDRFGEAEISSGTIAREAVGINLPASGKQVRLKVGQTVDATSGNVAESYERRAPPPPPSAKDLAAAESEARLATEQAAAREDAAVRRREAARVRRERLRAEPYSTVETLPLATAPAGVSGTDDPSR